MIIVTLPPEKLRRAANYILKLKGFRLGLSVNPHVLFVLQIICLKRFW